MTNDTSAVSTPARIDPAHLDAAARILDRDGLPALTQSAIAEEAGVSRVTLHRRGAGPEDFVRAILLRTSDDIRRSLYPVLTSADPAAARLTRALEILCEATERNSGIVAAIYRRPALPVPDRADSTTSLEFVEPFERILRDGVLDGTLRSHDPTADATLMANGTAWTYLQMRQAHGWEPQLATRKVIRMTTAFVLADAVSDA